MILNATIIKAIFIGWYFISPNQAWQVETRTFADLAECQSFVHAMEERFETELGNTKDIDNTLPKVINWSLSCTPILDSGTDNSQSINKTLR